VAPYFTDAREMNFQRWKNEKLKQIFHTKSQVKTAKKHVVFPELSIRKESADKIFADIMDVF
jgi:hypothetical protein